MMAGAVLSFLIAAPGAEAGLFGAQVTYQYLDPTSTNVADTMGPTTITAATSFNDTNSFAEIDTTFSNTQIIITNLCDCNYPGVAFEGPNYLFSGITISNATIDPASSSDYQLAALSFAANSVTVDFATIPPSVFVPQGDELILDVTSTATPPIIAEGPEPTSIALLGMGLVGIIGLSRRRRKRRSLTSPERPISQLAAVR
jgi:hypothetical protein